MNSVRRQRINKLAEIIREACDLQTPVDLRQAVERLGGTIEKESAAEYEAMVTKSGDGFKIILSNNEYDRRERFSIAHELGHLFLHMGYLIDEEKWKSVGDYTDSVYFRYGHSIEEHEANEFAAAFLMPKAEFVSIARDHFVNGSYDVDSIAGHFEVSRDAAVNRGRWLGLFSWR